MKLNPDCLRSILLTIEEKCNFNVPWTYQKDSFPSEYLTKYTHEEIIYHIKQAQKSNLIDGVHYYDGGISIVISDLTPDGHEFLANIRNDSIWKKVVSKTSGASLSIVLEVAKQVAQKHFLS